MENESDEEEHEYMTKDAIRRHQFDHNTNLCLADNYPEIFVDENGQKQRKNYELSFAPAEGNHPFNILTEKDWDIKSWPILLPDGKYGINHKRTTRLTDQQYFVQRISNRDKRFSQSPGYIFAAAAYIEQKQLSSKANISYRRGKKSIDQDGTPQYELNDGFTVFDGVRNTPKYWQKVKFDMIAKLENLGPFHLFFTLSCGDARCEENFSSFLFKNGYQLQYWSKADGSTQIIVDQKDGRIINKTLKQFLEEDVDESLHEMIRTNVLTATRNFHHRVNQFKDKVMMVEKTQMKIKYISYRVEFQGRGAAHIHGTLWLDIKDIEKLPIFSGNHLSKGFEKLREDVKLNDMEKEAISNFTNLFITCSTNPIFNKKAVEIAKEVNYHHCTRSCKKYEDKCRFDFPRFPLKHTLVIDKKEFSDILENNTHQDYNIESETKNYKKIISDVKDILNDADIVEVIMQKYPKGDNEEEYKNNREKRIDKLLEIAGGITYDDYIKAIKKTRKYGSTVMLKRDIDEIFINNYNSEWINAWNANLDIQPVLDYFAVITYVTDYWAKPDEGITPILKEAAEYLKSQPDQQKRCQQMANTFLTHRQMGEAEAYYKIFPNLTLKYSNIDTIFMPSDKKDLRSKFLMKLEESDDNYAKGAEVKGGRDGRFLEKPDIIDKYCRRDTENNSFVKELCPAQFGQMYEPIRRMKNEDEDTSIKNFDSDTNEKDELSTHIISAECRGKILPTMIKIKDPLPGEIPLWRKRSFPKALRIHKKRENNDAHRYYLSELLLFTSYTNESELGCDDEDKCRQLYFDKKDSIKYVKSHILPFAQGLEEARYYMEEITKNEEDKRNIGEDLDPTLEQELQDLDEEETVHPDFTHINPDEIEIEQNLAQTRQTLKHIQIKSKEELLDESRKLDQFQSIGSIYIMS